MFLTYCFFRSSSNFSLNAQVHFTLFSVPWICRFISSILMKIFYVVIYIFNYASLIHSIYTNWVCCLLQFSELFDADVYICFSFLLFPSDWFDSFLHFYFWMYITPHTLNNLLTIHEDTIISAIAAFFLSPRSTVAPSTSNAPSTSFILSISSPETSLFCKPFRPFCFKHFSVALNFKWL